MAEKKYLVCPECGGIGSNMIVKLYPTGHTEERIPCKICEGESYIEELDYLVLVLDGTIQ